MAIISRTVSSIILFAGMFTFALSQWGVLAVVARYGGREAAGAVSLAMSLAIPLSVLCSFSLRWVYLSDVSDLSDAVYAKARIFGFVLLLVLLGVVVSCRGDGWPIGTLILTVGLTRVVDGVSDHAYGVAQRNGNSGLMAWSLLLRGSLGLVAFVLGLAAGGLVWGVATMAVAWALVAVFHDRAFRSYWGLTAARSSLPEVFALLKIAAPAGVGAFLSGLILVVPRLVLEGTYGLADLGAFAVCAYAVTLGLLVVNTVGNTALVGLARDWRERRTRHFATTLIGLSGVMLGCGLAGTIIAWVSGEWILSVLYGDTFRGLENVFVSVCGAATLYLTGTLAGMLLTAVRMFRLELLLNGILLGVSVAVSLVLIPEGGLWGAVYVLWAIGATKCVLSLGHSLWCVTIMRKGVQYGSA